MKAVTSVRAIPHLSGRRIDLTWQNPSTTAFGSASLTNIRILRQERTFPRLPIEGLEGKQVYSDRAISQFSDRELNPLTTYYYTIFTQDSDGNFYADENSRVAVFATENYGLTERLYKLLPAVHQRYDLPLNAADISQLSSPIQQAFNALPPQLRDRGQLWRFFLATATTLDLIRSLAEGLRQLRDLDRVRPEFLPLLAQWLNWELDNTQPIFSQRNEIKFTPSFYRTVGTVPNLRNLVNRYTGWYAQVAEFAQIIALSNSPPQFNLFAIQPIGTTWQGTDDASAILGLGNGNNSATGSDGALSTAATLVSSTVAPFRLRPGMELAITADDRIPVSVRFQTGDFTEISNATAAEVATVLERNLSEVTAIARSDGRIELRSHLLGLQSALRVEQTVASLVALEASPRGRLSVFAEQNSRVRLFYEIADPTAPRTAQLANQALSGIPFAQGSIPGVHLGATAALKMMETQAIELPSLPQGRIHYKTYRQGTWGESYTLPGTVGIVQGEPAAVELPGGSLWLAWIENPNRDKAQLRFQTGTAQTPQPAQITSSLNQPFAIPLGTRLVIRGNWQGVEGIEFTATDFANPQSVSAAQMLAVINARLSHVLASANPNGTITLTTRVPGGTVAVGGDEFLEIDLGLSSGAAALGFDARNAIAQGNWGDHIIWSEPATVTSAGIGRHSDLQAVVDSNGIVWLFWSTHSSGIWQIVSSRWDGTNWSALETLADGIGGNREPYGLLDVTNRIWLFWSRRRGVGTREDIWTLRQRVFASASGWSTETAVTGLAPEERATDREAAVVRLPDNTLHVFFQSDRGGSSDLWSVTVTPTVTPETSLVSAPVAITNNRSADRSPAPLLMPDGALWLLYRSDRSLPLSRIAARPLSVPDNRITSPKAQVRDTTALTARASSDFVKPVAGRLSSFIAADTGTIQRFAGTTSVVPSDRRRMERRRQWDDFLSYTPQKPVGFPGERELEDSEFYTRGTVGLYLSPVIGDNPQTQQKVERLRPLLRRFLPINVRAVVILAPRVDLEYIYQPGRDLQESYSDSYPLVEYYSGLTENTSVSLPDWVIFRSNTLGNVTANLAELTTLRSRTYYPPPL